MTTEIMMLVRYTTVAKQAREHLQFDQGEDRWLCTLLLQRGWRVEYSAASDSFTGLIIWIVRILTLSLHPLHSVPRGI